MTKNTTVQYTVPSSIPWILAKPLGLEGVLQSIVTSFLIIKSISTALKNATDYIEGIE